MYGGLKEQARREATPDPRMEALKRAFAGAARPVVERRVVVPAQAEQVEIVLRLTQAQADKVRSLLGMVESRDQDTHPLYLELEAITTRRVTVMNATHALIFKD